MLGAWLIYQKTYRIPSLKESRDISILRYQNLCVRIYHGMGTKRQAEDFQNGA